MAKTNTKFVPLRTMPRGGGSSIRDPKTGELRPNPPLNEPAAEPAPKGE